MNKIRLGFVRADTHAYYYGIMLDQCDPMILMKTNYVVHHYATSGWLKNGMNVMIMNISTDVFPESCSFYASAYSKYGAVHSEPIGDLQFLGGGQKILEMLKEMVETCKPPVEYEVFLEPIAVIEAGQLAQKVG